MAGKRKKRSLRSPLLSVTLFVLAAGLLLGSGIGGARAALTFYSDTYNPRMELTDRLGVTLVTPDGGDDILSAAADLQPGKRVSNPLYVTNSGTIPEYVRVTIHKSWTNAAGEKVWTNAAGDTVYLDPALIRLELGSGWIVDDKASTPERTVLYYGAALAANASTANFLEALTVDSEVLHKVTRIENKSGDYTTVTNVYDYNGAGVSLSVDVDVVQTHNAEAAILSAWGRSVTVSNGTLTLK